MPDFEILKEYLTRDKHVYAAAQMSDDGLVEHLYTRAPGPFNCYSVSKSVTGCAMGILEARGLLRDTDTLYSHIGELFPADCDPKWKTVRLCDIAHHRTGVGDVANIDIDTMDFWADGRSDFLAHVLSCPIIHEPGEGPFVYCDTNYYLIARVVEKITGMTCADFLQKEMFNPLRWRGNAWGTCPQNHTLGGTGLFARAQDLAVWGYMVACGGVFEGRRILTEEYIAKARGVPADAGYYGYGFQAQEGNRWFAAFGMYGQGVYIFPEKRCCFCVMGSLVDTESIRNDMVPLYLK